MEWQIDGEREGKGERILAGDGEGKRRALTPRRKGLPEKCGLRAAGEGEGRGREASALESGGRETDPRGRAVQGGPAQRLVESSVGSFVRKLLVASMEREGEREEETGEGEGGAGGRGGWSSEASCGSFSAKAGWRRNREVAHQGEGEMGTGGSPSRGRESVNNSRPESERETEGKMREGG